MSDTADPGDFYVYALLREDRETPFYIGKGRNRRWLHHECPCHLRRNTHRSNVIRKLLDELGEVPKIKLAEGLAEAVAHAMERALIAQHGRWPAGPLVNKTEGGEGVLDRTGDVGRKISQRKRGHAVSQATRELLRLRNLGRKPTIQTRAKQSAAMAGRQRTPEHNAKLAAAKRGKPRSAETKAKISVAKRGQRLTPEHAAKIGDGHRGLKRPPETRARMRAAALKRGSARAAAQKSVAPPDPEPLLVPPELPQLPD